MIEAARALLKTFDQLSRAEQREVAVEILGRLRDLDTPPLDGETPAQIADDSSQEYDAREMADGQK